MSGLLQDLRFAFRHLRKSPGFSLVAVLTLALGIGANAAVLAVVQSVLLAPLPYRNADRVVALNTHFMREARTIPRMTGPDLVDIRSQAGGIEKLAYYYGGEIGVQLPDHAAFTNVQIVTAGFPDVLGVMPVAGRLFADNEAEHSALIGANFARDHFGNVENAVGKPLGMEGKVYEIVGVLPGNFSFPQSTQVWIGGPTDPEKGLSNRTAFNYRAIAKLKQGIAVGTVQSQLDTIGERLRAANPADNKDKSFTVLPLQEQLVGKVRPLFLLLLAAVGVVLLIACVNVAHLQLARATTRTREVALRTVLGASRWRVVRQVLLESLVLALSGGVVGVLFAGPLLKLFLRLAPAGIPRLDEVHISLAALGLIALVCVLATLLSGFAPAWQTLRLNVNESLKQDASRGLAGRGVARLRSVLVVAEIALTFVLAAGAGLLVRTILKLDATETGFRSDHLLVMYAHAPANTLPEYLGRAQMFNELFDRLRAVPGVQSVAGVMGLPSGDYGSNGAYQIEGQPVPASFSDMPYAVFSAASPRYFSTMSIPLLRGRDFTGSDNYTGTPVAIISESLAHKMFANQDPLGHQIRCGMDEESGKWMTIVGVVGDVRQDSPASTPGPAIYMPLAQHPYRANEIQVVMHSQVPPLSLMETARKLVEGADSQIAIRFTTMDSMLTESTATPRFRSWLVGGFALLGLVLAMLGIYGVMAYTVAQRTFEVGVRMTFGAKPADILGMVLGRAMRLTAAGIVVGLLLTAVAARLMSSMLFAVSPGDPVSFGLAIGILAVVALAAAYIPARRAAAVNPSNAIRYE
ncbi:MAG TPA: ABC transporter permease [Candidatus Koribacter sp.]|jgi:predicted permease